MKIIIIFCLWKLGVALDTEPSYIPSNWVDPTDMRNYNRQTKSMKPLQVAEKNDTMENINSQKDARDINYKVERFEIFLQRFINRILLTANLKNKVLQPETRITTEIPVLITSEELSKLNSLGESITVSELNELDTLFSAIFNHKRDYSFDKLTPYLNPIEQLFYNTTWEKLTITIITIIFGVVIWMFAVGESLRRIMILIYLTFFMGGLAWNWWNMYQEAVAEQFAEVKKFSYIPDVCAPVKTSIFSYLFGWPVKDECKEYHKSFQVDPFSKVSPSIVLSETISIMMIHPLKFLGTGLGDFIKGINGAAPWPFSIIFLPFIYLTTLIFVFCCFTTWCGIRLNFWTWFGGINIGGRSSKEINYPKVNDEIHLQNMIENESGQEYILIQVRTVRQYLFKTQAIKDHCTFPVQGEGDSGNLFRSNCLVDDRSHQVKFQHSQPETSHVDTDVMLQLKKYLPKQKYFGKSLSQKSVICKKKYK